MMPTSRSTPPLVLKDLKIDPDIFEKIPAKFACHYKVIPIKFEDGTLTLAIEDPLDLIILDDISLFLGLKIEPVSASRADILEAIREHYGLGAETIEEIINTGEMAGEIKLTVSKTEDIEGLAEDASIIKFVNQILVQAVKDSSTDIHIEPYEDELKIR